MSNAKRGLRTLGLSLVAAMGLMAFMAASAHAVTWDINGAEIKANETITGKLKAGQTALILVPALSQVIHCTGFNVLEGTLRTDNTGHAKITYTGCTTKIKGVENAGCKPEILAASAKILPILHSGKVYFLVEALTAGQPYAEIHYNEETCALAPLVSVTGTVVFECENAGTGAQKDCKEAASPQLIRPAPPALFLGDPLKMGASAAEIHGKVELSLSGANVGKAFNGLI